MSPLKRTAQCLFSWLAGIGGFVMLAVGALLAMLTIFTDIPAEVSKRVPLVEAWHIFAVGISFITTGIISIVSMFRIGEHFKKANERIDGLGNKIDGLGDGLGNKIDGLGDGLGNKIDGMRGDIRGMRGDIQKLTAAIERALVQPDGGPKTPNGG